MFSGIIQTVGKISQLESESSGARLAVNCNLFSNEQCEIGESISVNGVCLTAVSARTLSEENFEVLFDVSQETLRKTTLGDLQVGSEVNLERALQIGARLGGHFVLGHVDETAEVLEVLNEGDSLKVVFSFSPEIRSFVAPKGSIVVDGVSLTSCEVKSNSFAVYLVRHTIENTCFSHIQAGARVNLEVDCLARYVSNIITK